jgi:hypothetical protein
LDSCIKWTDPTGRVQHIESSPYQSIVQEPFTHKTCGTLTGSRSSRCIYYLDSPPIGKNHMALIGPRQLLRIFKTVHPQIVTNKKKWKRILEGQVHISERDWSGCVWVRDRLSIQ